MGARPLIFTKSKSGLGARVLNLTKPESKEVLAKCPLPLPEAGRGGKTYL